MHKSATCLAVLAMALATGHARAQGKPLAPPASDAMPPVELTIGMEGGKPVCAPAELRLPAETNVEIHVRSTADTPVILTAPGQFENGNVLHADGDLVHAASEKAYTVKQNGKGMLRLRTMKAGEYPYGCTSNRNADASFVGKLILAAPGG